MSSGQETSAPLHRRIIGEVPLVVVSGLLLATAADILPHESLVDVGEVKLTLSRLLIIAGLAALVYDQGARARLFRSRLEIPLLLLLAAALVTSLKWQTAPPYRFLAEGVALFYLTVGVVRSRREARTALLVVALVALALSALPAISQVSQGEATGFYRDGCVPVTKPRGVDEPGALTRATGPFQNPNVLAGHILLVAPLGAVVTAIASPIQSRVAMALIVSLGYLGLFLTFSRAAVFFALASAGAAIAASRLPHRRYLAAIGIALAVASLFLFAACGSEGTAGFGRKEEWRQTMNVIRDNPVYGVGLGRAGDAISARIPTGNVAHAHNLFLTWWADAGPVALLAWLWIFRALVWWTLRSARRGDTAARGTFAALLGFAGFSLLDHPANVEEVAIALWVVAGIAAATAVAGDRPGRLTALVRRRARA